MTRETKDTIIRRQAQRIGYLERQIDALLEKQERLTESLATERALQQSQARQRTNDAIAAAGWRG